LYHRCQFLLFSFLDVKNEHFANLDIEIESTKKFEHAIYFIIFGLKSNRMENSKRNRPNAKKNICSYLNQRRSPISERKKVFP
jgi:hypothetical protein